MRKEPTPAEAALWISLRNSALGVRFRRQHAIDRFIVDFVCLDRGLIVELDGAIHEDPHRNEVDQERTAILSSHGFTVVRYTNSDVLQRMDDGLDRIKAQLSLSSSQRSRNVATPGGPQAV